MLQKITVEDIKNVNPSLSRVNLLETYEILRRLQKNENHPNLKHFYFDDNFCWCKRDLGRPPKNNRIIEGEDLYGFKLDVNNSIKNFVQEIKDIGVSYGGGDYRIERYLIIIFNKLRPEEE